MLCTNTIGSGDDIVATLRFTVAWRGESFSPSSLVMAVRSAAVILWSEAYSAYIDHLKVKYAP
jgi:hypothetical protein